jgi:hypothetical protein
VSKFRRSPHTGEQMPVSMVPVDLSQASNAVY